MEYLLLGSYLYNTISIYHYYDKLNSLNNDGVYKDVKLETIEDDVIGISLYHITTERIFLLNKLRTIKNNNTFFNYNILDKEVDKFYVYDINELKSITSIYNIDTQKIFFKFPLEVDQYTLHKNVYAITGKFNYLGNNKYIGTNKKNVIQKFVRSTRLPLSFTFGAFSIIGSLFMMRK